MKFRLAMIGVVALALSSAACVVKAQEFRATVSGTVTDPSGAPVPNAKVTATETDTGTKTSTVSDNAGAYTVPFLLPGNYSVKAEAQGFKDFIQSGIHLASSDHPIIDIHLTLGVATESVEVVAGVPLINTENASTGQTITTKQVEDLPLNGRTPMMLASLSIGVIATSSPTLVHPFDNNAAAAWSIGGTPSQTSELLMDGSPDEIWSGSLAYSPPQDAVQEVTVKAFDTDAAYGHTFAGTANQILKTGTNDFHGSLYEFSQVSALDANNFFNNAEGLANPVTHYNQYGLTAGAPVIIPKIFNGRNRLFWFFAWENLSDEAPSPPYNQQASVPTAAEEAGDFTALYSVPAPIGPTQLYNPYSGTQSGSTITRQPFMCDSSGNPLAPNLTPGPGFGTQPAGTACNKIPQALLNPVSQAYLQFFPKPNATGAATGEGNFVVPILSTDSFDNELGRLDWNMTSRSHLFLDVRHNDRAQLKNDYFDDLGTGTTLTRLNWGGTLDEVYTFTPTVVADVRVNWTFLREVHGDPSVGFDPTTLGFPSYITAGANQVQLPAITFTSGSASCGSSTAEPTTYQCLGNTGDSNVPSQSYQIFGDVVKIFGTHTLKFGTDDRLYRLTEITYGSPAGSYTFGASGKTASWTNGPTSTSTNEFGQDFASFLLGLPNSGTYSLNAYGSYHSFYYSVFAQDDWRVTPHLTLNLGVRYDHDNPYVEQMGRTVDGFDSTDPSPIAAAAEAAYAAHPISQIPPASFLVNGGLTFPSPSEGNVYQNHSHIVSPRFGFAYSPGFLHDKTVIRGGFGIFVAPIGFTNLALSGTYSSNPIVDQEGFSASTAFVATSNNFLTPATVLSNPFPSGIQQPTGSTLGLGTFLGQNISFLDPNMKDAYSERWNLGIQHSFTPNLMFELDYMGNHAVHLPIAVTQLNVIPRQFLCSCSTVSADQAVISSLNQTVTNPFKGLLPGASINGSTTSVSQLLAVFPEFPDGEGSTGNGIIMQNAPGGSSWFDSLNARVEQRLSHGLTLIGVYEFSKLIEADSDLNDTDLAPERRISPFDHPQHFVAAFSYELPIGRGKALNLQSGWLNAIAGGWVVNGIYTYQTGAPVVWANDMIYLGGPLLSDPHQVNGPAFSKAAFDTTAADQYQFHIRTWPSTLSSVRQDAINELDASILKNFSISERFYLQLRMEAFDVLNYPNFGAPNVTPTSSSFGLITSQANLPRQVQLGARLAW